MKRALSLAITLTCMMGMLSACKETEEPEPYMSFALNGIPRTYIKGGQFSRTFCDYSTNCCHFFADANHSTQLSIQIGIPGDAIVGHTYVNGDYRFVLRYYDSGNNRHDFAKDGTCALTLTGWEGPGGWATGVFSGRMLFDATDSLVITGGNFRARISTN